MIKFRQKTFGKTKKTLDFIKENPTLVTSTAAVGIGGANLAINSKRTKEARELSNRQLDMMEKQMDAIKANTSAVNRSINSQKEVSNAFREGINKVDTPKRKRKSLFGIFNSPESSKSKEFSIKSSTIEGAKIGGVLATAAVPFAPNEVGSIKFLNKIPTKKGKELANNLTLGYNNSSPLAKNTAIVISGVLIGAALGALVGSIGELSNTLSRRSVNADRLMKDILSILKKDNFKEGKDFTRDPKMADRLKTRVCIAVSRNSGDLRVLINTKADPKLKTVTERAIKNIPNAGVVTRTARNEFNDITISTISDNSADAGLVSGIVSQFIHSGFPVYLVEVG